ncbi:B12-binding domain-containing radical SAM protein [Paenibacillus sp. FSL R7-0302]|uniref:B12-binding domain-containing radical SAM protein n=1 Tax=Paenibacillus sp. FSL R7-0302 TaxID=2921681 RepID=UPI0030FC3638
MKILLLYLNPFDWASIAAPPYGLEIISNYVKRNVDDTTTSIVNPFAFKNMKDDLKQLLLNFQPEMIGLSIRNLDNMANIWTEKAEACNGIKTRGFLQEYEEVVRIIKAVTQVPVIVGGAGFSIAPAAILKRLKLNLGIAGPGEVTFAKLANAVKSKLNLTRYIDNNLDQLDGMIYVSPEADRVSPPAHATYSAEMSFFERAVQYSPKWTGSVPVRVSTGCTGKCSFCVEGSLFPKNQWRCIEDIINEIKLNNNHNEAVWLACSELNDPDESNVIELCNAIRKSGVKNRFSSYFTPAPFSKEQYYALKAANFSDHSICFGITHVSDHVLRKNNIAHRKKDIDQLIKTLVEAGASGITVGFIVGLPGEDEQTLNELMQWIKEMDNLFGEGLRCFYNCGVRVYPNTQLARIIQKQGDRDNLYGEAGPDFLEPVVFSTPCAPEEMNQRIIKAIGKTKGIVASYNLGNELLQEDIKVAIHWQRSKYHQFENNYKEAIGELLEIYPLCSKKSVREKLMLDIIQLIIEAKKQDLNTSLYLNHMLKNSAFYSLVD